MQEHASTNIPTTRPDRVPVLIAGRYRVTDARPIPPSPRPSVVSTGRPDLMWLLYTLPALGVGSISLQPLLGWGALVLAALAIGGAVAAIIWSTGGHA